MYHIYPVISTVLWTSVVVCLYQIKAELELSPRNLPSHYRWENKSKFISVISITVHYYQPMNSIINERGHSNDSKQVSVVVITKQRSTHKLPANPAALFSIIVGSGGLHIIMSSWSDCITTPGNWGNHTRTWTNP